MHTVTFEGAVVTLMVDIPVDGIMKKSQHYYPECHDELVDIMGIYLNWIMNQLSDRQRRCVHVLIGLI